MQLEKKNLSHFFVGNLYSDFYNQQLERSNKSLLSAIEKSVVAFYDVLQNDSATSHYFSNHLVEQHLKVALKSWLEQTLTAKHSKEAINELVNEQRKVGQVHSRIEVPMQLVTTAMLVIKQSLFASIRECEDLLSDEKSDLIIVVDTLLDASLNLINESYLEGHIESQRTAQEYRNRTSAQELAIEIERIKGSLFGWLTQFMTDLFSESITNQADINHQEFALWVRHKLDFVGTDKSIILKIKEKVDQLQIELSIFFGLKNSERKAAIKKINSLANAIGWLLTEVADENLERSTREDPLTSLIGRRFMAPILQKESQLSRKTNVPYSIMMLDVDDFKSMNDLYGHQAGDQVLSQMGHVMKSLLRVTDYAFRYGGEEFLVLMPETNLKNAVTAAEKLLNKVRDIDVYLENERRLKVTVSIGVAEFDGHPDYEHLIKVADEKLYEAKHNGKNRLAF